MFKFEAIGYVSSPFQRRFAVPRQPGLAPEARGVVKLGRNPDLKTALRGLEGFSHIWLVFVFHDHGATRWKPSIRPPRLGGSEKVGVLASRSPHRPNPIGLSAVRLEKIDIDAKDGPELFVSGIDLLDGTPILDIKPYIPYADAWPDANPGWAGAPIPKTAVAFDPVATEKILAADPDGLRGLRTLIVEVLELDPRPAYQQRKNPVRSEATWGQRYGFDVMGYDVQYEIRDRLFYVFDLLSTSLIEAFKKS